MSVGGKLMIFYTVVLESLTYANKAQRILSSKGYSCEVIKTNGTTTSGCGYGIRVGGEIKTILQILDAAYIRYKTFTESGGNDG